MTKTSYTCPRCNNKNIIDLGETIECTDCRLEFSKEDLERFDKHQILAISEKIDLTKILKEE